MALEEGLEPSLKLLGVKLEAAGVDWDSLEGKAHGALEFIMYLDETHPNRRTWMEDSTRKLHELGIEVVETGSAYDKYFHSSTYWIKARAYEVL